jgi:TRAP-type uncharacterized transport system substrate-binding protein
MSLSLFRLLGFMTVTVLGAMSMTAPAFSQLVVDPQPAADNLVVAQVAPKKPPSAVEAGEGESVSRVNNWTVGLAGGLLEGTFVRFAADLGKALDDGDNLRVLPIVTYGAAENVNDLLYLKGVDIAITDADVFDTYKKERKYANIDKRINYISEMFVGEFHLLARAEIQSFKDLEGKRVGFNTKGSAANITGKIVFERLGINVEKVFINNAIGIEQMKTGELAAIVHTVGKPNGLFQKTPSDQGFHFLPLEYSDKFADYYVPTSLNSEDYPKLIKPGEKIPTIGVPVVMAVYNWPKGSDRARRVERFIQYYFSRFDTLKKPPYQAKWKEVNLAAKVDGWTRYWAAEEQLALIGQERPAAVPAAAAAAKPGRASAQAGQDSNDKLYDEFIAWKKQHGMR